MYFCRIDRIIALITNKIVRENIPTNNSSHKTFEFPLWTYFEAGQGRKLDQDSLHFFDNLRTNKKLDKHLTKSCHIEFSRSGAPLSLNYKKMTVRPSTKLIADTKALMMQVAADMEKNTLIPTPNDHNTTRLRVLLSVGCETINFLPATGGRSR
jgi:hypothetical protein